METLADLLHGIVDLLPWREESQVRKAHEIIESELSGTKPAVGKPSADIISGKPNGDAKATS